MNKVKPWRNQSQNQDLYSEGCSKYRVLQKGQKLKQSATEEARFQTQTAWRSTHGKPGRNPRIPSALFKPVIHTVKLNQGPASKCVSIS